MIRIHILYHASKEPILGLGMIEELQCHGYKLSPGTLYPLLHGLEGRGYLRWREVRLRKRARRLYRATAARSGAALAKTDYLPRADMLWQGNSAARNGVFGLPLPNLYISSSSGRVLPSALNDSVWESAAELLFAWEPLDCGPEELVLYANHFSRID